MSPCTTIWQRRRNYSRRRQRRRQPRRGQPWVRPMGEADIHVSQVLRFWGVVLQ